MCFSLNEHIFKCNLWWSHSRKGKESNYLSMNIWIRIISFLSIPEGHKFLCNFIFCMRLIIYTCSRFSHAQLKNEQIDKKRYFYHLDRRHALLKVAPPFRRLIAPSSNYSLVNPPLSFPSVYLVPARLLPSR